MRNESCRHRLLWARVSLLLSAVVLIALFLRATIGSAQERCSYDEIPIADAHFHLLDFLQNSAYLDPQSGEETPPIGVDRPYPEIPGQFPVGVRQGWRFHRREVQEGDPQVRPTTQAIEARNSQTGGIAELAEDRAQGRTYPSRRIQVSRVSLHAEERSSQGSVRGDSLARYVSGALVAASQGSRPGAGHCPLRPPDTFSKAS